ncbi:unnamed protein product [Chrysoparadoxa australica]
MSDLDIWRSAYVGDIARVKELVEGGQSPDSKDVLKGSTPLHWACFGGHLNLVLWLVKEMGVDINALNNDGCTPIYFACEQCHTGLVQWLVRDGGAMVNVKDTVYQQTPLHRVCFKGHQKKEEFSEELLTWLATEGGCDLGAVDRFGNRVEEVYTPKGLSRAPPGNRIWELVDEARNNSDERGDEQAKDANDPDDISHAEPEDGSVAEELGDGTGERKSVGAVENMETATAAKAALESAADEADESDESDAVAAGDESKEAQVAAADATEEAVAAATAAENEVVIAEPVADVKVEESKDAPDAEPAAEVKVEDVKEAVETPDTEPVTELKDKVEAAVETPVTAAAEVVEDMKDAVTAATGPVTEVKVEDVKEAVEAPDAEPVTELKDKVEAAVETPVTAAAEVVEDVANAIDSPDQDAVEAAGDVFEGASSAMIASATELDDSSTPGPAETEAPSTSSQPRAAGMTISTGEEEEQGNADMRAAALALLSSAQEAEPANPTHLRVASNLEYQTISAPEQSFSPTNKRREEEDRLAAARVRRENGSRTASYVIDDIKSLVEKKNSGLITEAEFQKQKQMMLEMETIRLLAEAEQAENEAAADNPTPKNMPTTIGVGQNTPPGSPGGGMYGEDQGQSFVDMIDAENKGEESFQSEGLEALAKMRTPKPEKATSSSSTKKPPSGEDKDVNDSPKPKNRFNSDFGDLEDPLKLAKANSKRASKLLRRGESSEADTGPASPEDNAKGKDASPGSPPADFQNASKEMLSSVNQSSLSCLSY